MFTNVIPLKQLAILSLIASECLIARSQLCRYHDSLFATINTTEDVTYATPLNFGVPETLKMVIVRPEGDTQVNRPAIIMVHGGGFNSGNNVDPRVLEMCRRFSIRGYVTASIGYRLYTQNPFNEVAANYKAMQDARSAIRFLRGNAATYGVNPEKIFIFGFSAGAFIANHSGYWDYDEVADSLKAAYGNFEASGNPGVADTVSGVMGWAGGIIDTTWLNNETVPWGSVHNTTDPSVNYWGTNAYYGSGSINQYRQNHSLPSSLLTVNFPNMHTPDLGTPAYDTFSAPAIDFIYNQLQTGCNVLPVLLLDFKAALINGLIVLKWVTSSEMNSSHFNVERSRDGINFTYIGRVNAVNHSNMVSQYSFNDTYKLKGRNYYRLQQVDRDNRTMYSKIVSLDLNSSTFINFTTNPVHDKLFIQLQHLPPANAAWRMYNLNGQKIYQEKLLSTVIEKNISALAPGMYLVEIIIHGRTERIKIVKQ